MAPNCYTATKCSGLAVGIHEQKSQLVSASSARAVAVVRPLLPSTETVRTRRRPPRTLIAICARGWSRKSSLAVRSSVCSEDAMLFDLLRVPWQVPRAPRAGIAVAPARTRILISSGRVRPGRSHKRGSLLGPRLSEVTSEVILAHVVRHGDGHLTEGSSPGGAHVRVEDNGGRAWTRVERVYPTCPRMCTRMCTRMLSY